MAPMSRIELDVPPIKPLAEENRGSPIWLDAFGYPLAPKTPPPRARPSTIPLRSLGGASKSAGGGGASTGTAAAAAAVADNTSGTIAGRHSTLGAALDSKTASAA